MGAMKTQVIQLDPHDDVISIRDKMTWVRTPRLLLVYPKRGAALARTLDLLLLQRHATSLGVHLGLVAASAEVRQRARELDIPVFTSALAAQKADWPETARKLKLRRKGERPDLRQMRLEARPAPAAWTELPAVRLFFFSLAVLALLAMLLVFLPSATVSLSPTLESQTLTINLSASPDVTAVSAAEGLPARSTSLALTGTKKFSVTTRASVPDQYAEGTAQFQNLTLSVVGIPAGTVIQSLDNPPVRFVTLEDRVIAGEVGRTMDIPVRAVEPGLAGNLTTGSLVVVEGVLGPSLSVTNPEPTAGGTEKVTNIALAEDRSRLHDALLTELRQQAIDELSAALEPGSMILPGTILPSAGVTETFSPAPGETGATLTLTISGEFAAQYVTGSDLRLLENAILDTSLPAGYESLPDTLTQSRVGEPITGADGVTRWTVNLYRSMHPRLDTELAAQMIQGRARADAINILKNNFGLRSEPVIEIAPPFWPWLPVTALRISVVLP
jgi:hypothetical protein